MIEWSQSYVLIGAKGATGAALCEAVHHALEAAGYDRVGTEDGYLQGGPSRRADRDVAVDGLCLGILSAEDRSMAEITYPPDLAPKLAADIAAGLNSEVQLFTLQTLAVEGRPLECGCGHFRVGSDGGITKGQLGDWLDEEFGPSTHDPDGRWMDLCDGKAYFAMGALIETVTDHFFESAHPTAPAGDIYRERKLGSPRLDEIARRVRSGHRAEVIQFRDQVGIRVEGPGNAKTTSFVKELELTILLQALGSKLIDRRSG